MLFVDWIADMLGYTQSDCVRYALCQMFNRYCRKLSGMAAIPLYAYSKQNATERAG